MPNWKKVIVSGSNASLNSLGIGTNPVGGFGLYVTNEARLIGTNEIRTDNAQSSLYTLDITRTTIGLTSQGNIGIKNPNPIYELDISGSIRATGSIYFPGLTNTPQTNIVTFNPSTGQLYYVTSSTLSLSGGTTNVVPLWTSPTTLGTSVISQSSGNIGINISPSTYLHLKEASNTGIEGFYITNWNNVITVKLGSDTTLGGGKLLLNSNAGTTNVSLTSYANNYISGSLGVGVVSPAYKLDVDGDARIATSLIATSVTASLFGTSSWSQNSLTSSFVTASNVRGPYGASSVLSSSFAISSSFAVTSSFTVSSSYALSSSLSQTSSFITASNVRGPHGFNSVITSSYSISSSSAISSSFATRAQNISGGTNNYVALWNSTTTLSSSLLVQSPGIVTAYGLVASYIEQAGAGTNLIYLQNRDTTAGVTHQTRFGTQQLGAGAARTLLYAASPNTADTAGELAIISENGGQVISTIGKYTTGVNNTLSLYVSGSPNTEIVRLHTAGNSFLNGGNVGIGISSPSTKLHISGTTGGIFEVDGANAVNGLYVNSSGNVGLGTVSPSYKLDVSGTTRITSTVILTGLSTQPFGNVVTYDISTGQLYYTASSAIGGGGLSGGTTNFVPLWTSPTTLGSSIISQSSSNIGIGITPSYKLDVGGQLGISNKLFAAVVGDYNTIYSQAGNVGIYLGGGGDPANYYYNTKHYFRNIAGATKVTIDATNGWLGINVDPTQVLDVAAQFAIAKFTSTTGTNAAFFQYVNTGGNFYLGVEGSTGATFGASAYAGVVYHSGAYPIQFFTSATLRATLTSGGNLGIGANTSTTTYKLDVNASGATGARVFSGSLAVGNILPSATVGRIDASNDVVAFSTSDMRFKTNIIPISGALDKITQIGGYEFDWVPNQEYHGFEGHDVGVIAQEIEKVLPEVVKERDSGYKAVKYEKIVPLLIEAIKEQQQQIDELRYLLQNKT
jgi:hypothetical protein